MTGFYLTLLASLAISVSLVFTLRKKPFFICAFNPIIITVIIALPILLLQPLFASPNTVINRLSVGTVVTYTATLVLLSGAFASLGMIMLGCYSWVKFGKDAKKKALAKKQIIAGITSLILIFATFVAVNIYLSSLSLGYQTLRIPEGSLSDPNYKQY